MRVADILVVGRSSLLARHFAARHAQAVLRSVGHADADAADHFEGVRCIVNFAFAPALEQGDYDAALDIDLRLARAAARRGLHYVMISSRRVYAQQAQWNASESSPATGLDAYGRNKARIEAELRARLGDRLTILRPGNVIAEEAEIGRRRFGAYLQRQLLETGRIRLTVDPAARRDLVPVEFFCDAVRAAARGRVTGVFNVGAGRSTTVGDAARWLIEGFGAGDVEADPALPPDEFQLDCTRLREALGLACGEGAVADALRGIGRRLARRR